MEDQLVSFETAKLAKEKGFNEETWDYYQSQGQLMSSPYDNGPGKWNDDIPFVLYTAPTQSLLQKWLREKQAHIECHTVMTTNGVKWKFYLTVYLEGQNGLQVKYVWNPIEYRNTDKVQYLYYSSYEEGLEEALKHVLNFL